MTGPSFDRFLPRQVGDDDEELRRRAWEEEDDGYEDDEMFEMLDEWREERDAD